MAAVCNELGLVSAALREILAVSSSGERRKAAHQIIEEFKEKSIYCADIGLALYSDKSTDAAVRHIGLTFIEVYFKNKWNVISKEDHDRWKEKTLLLLKNIDYSEPGHIKESIAKLVVELVKREWPQNWGSLLVELGEIQSIGAVQLEVTLLIFLRLAEDVMLSLDPHLQQQRRRNIEQGLSENIESLFQFFISTLSHHVGLFKESRQPINHRLAEESLFTLTAYLNSVPLELIFASDCLLLQMLCRLLQEPQLQMAASECLLIVAERRKDKVDVRLPLLILFSDDAVGLFLEVARKSCLVGPEDENYKFLKKICDVLIALGSCQLTDIWGHDRGISKRPDGFERYLKLILDLTNHPSQVICLKSLTVFGAFLKHELISKDEVFRESIPHFLTALGPKLFKHGDPSKDDHPSCEYSNLDHDSSEEYLLHFSKLRSMLAATVRDCTYLLPLEGFQQVYKWILSMKSKNNLQDIIEWEALSMFSDAVFSRVWRSEKIPENISLIEERGNSINIVTVSNELLQFLIQFESEVPQLLALVFTCLQSLFPFFKRSQTYLLSSVEKIILTFTKFPFKHEDKEILQVRRQATACFVNLCKEDSPHLLPYFDDFRNYVDKLQQDKVLSSQEKITVIEGLLLLSNGMPDSKRQAYINDLLATLDPIVAESSFKQALESTESFIEFIGLTQAPNENGPGIDNRQKINSVLQLLLAIVRRARLSEAEKLFIKNGGGFFANHPGCSWISKVTSFLPAIIRITRHIGVFWSPQIRGLVHKEYIPSLQINDSDKYYLFGQHLFKSTKESILSSSSLISKTANFLHGLHYNSYALLGQLGGLLEDYFYNLDGLVEMLISDVMSSWIHLPKFRFIFVFKSFLKPFVTLCPAACYAKVIGPIISVALESMLKVLTEEWNEFSGENYKGKIIDASTTTDGENPDDAVVAERLMFSLSREYIEMIVSFFFHKKKDGEESKEATNSPENSAPELGELGKYFMESELINKHVVWTLFTSLIWPDTASVNKVARVIPFLVNFIRDRTSLDSKIDSSIIDYLFTCVLKGMEIHGAELSAQGSLLTCALLMYLNLRVSYPSLVRIMLMVPSCKKEQLMKFDLDVFERDCTLTEKKKRESFKKFLSDAFGKNVSELYKANIHIKDLPPLAPRKKPKPDAVVDEGITTLFGDSLA